MSIRIEGHVPFREVMLCTRPELSSLHKVLGIFGPKGARHLEALARTFARERRTVVGLPNAVKAFRYYSPGREEEAVVGLGGFLRTEFPAYLDDNGSVFSLQETVPKEFVVTPTYTVVLFYDKDKKESLLLVRYPDYEISFALKLRPPSVAEAIMDVERQSSDGKRLLAPVAKEIVECNLLGK